MEEKKFGLVWERVGTDGVWVSYGWRDMCRWVG